jgi:hypothetical protein
MPITNKNVALVHRKEWQMMTPCPVATAAGSFTIIDSKEVDNLLLFVSSNSVQYLYHHDEDAWVQIPSLALAGTFGAGSCGCKREWSNTITANGGSTTTVTTATAITGMAIGKTVRFLTGANAGREAVVTGAIIIPGGTSTLQFSALPSAVVNTDTFALDTGLFLIMNGGTVGAGIYKSFDPLTGVITSLGTTGLPATWGTEGRLITTSSLDVFATGTATSATSTTLVNSGKAWTTGKWINYQVRITGGTGIGQIRTITANTGTTLTVAAWTVTPDNTSTYNIEGNDDFVYLLGNNAITMYRYSFTSNTWTTMAPTVARGGSMIAGGGANWTQLTGDTNFDDENTGFAGRYIFSFRGGATSTLDRFDIAGGTAGAGAWAAITYVNNAETFTTGSSYAAWTRYIIIRKDATNRFFKYSVRGNYMESLSTNMYPDGAAILGDKLWIKNYVEGGIIKATWLYSLANTGTVLHRLLLY